MANHPLKLGQGNTPSREADRKADSTNGSTAKRKFDLDYRIAGLSAIGLLGLIVGSVILFYPNIFYKQDSVFHEIDYTPKRIADPLIVAKIKTGDLVDKGHLNDLEELIKKSEGDPANKNSWDEKIKKKKEEKTRDSLMFNKYKSYQDNYSYTGGSDTLYYKKLNNDLHFEITPAKINHWDKLYRDTLSRKEFKARVALKNPALPETLTGDISFGFKKAISNVDFVAKYPSAGLWTLLIIIFCSFCFICVTRCIDINNRIVKLFDFNNVTRYSNYTYYIICLLCLVAIGILSASWYITFLDNYVVKSIFFMRTQTTSMTWVLVIGYVTGAFCLGGFIQTSSMLSFFSKDHNTKRAAITDKINVEGQTSKIDAELEELKKQNESDQPIFIKLNDYFRSYFILTAIVLTLLVLCTGALFNTVNSLDFIKLLADDWGYSPARPDFIYLYGALHTVIILLVYLPAQLRFAEMQSILKEVKEPGNEDGQKKEKLNDILKNPFGQLKDVLIAASPLLAGIIQSLFDLFFN